MSFVRYTRMIKKKLEPILGDRSNGLELGMGFRTFKINRL